MNNLKNILLITIIFCGLSVASADEALIPDHAVNVEIFKILSEAEVYPNPADDYVYLKINDKSLTEDIEIEVMSIIGNEMKITHEKVSEGLYKIDVSNIPSGHYYVLLTIDAEKSLKRFIKA